jgi:hypothetical protein
LGVQRRRAGVASLAGLIIEGVSFMAEEISKWKMVHSSGEVEEMRMVDFRERIGRF